jgi:hypothetical protein
VDFFYFLTLYMKKNKFKKFTEVHKKAYNIVEGGVVVLIEQFKDLQLEILWDDYVLKNVSPELVNKFNEQMDSLNVLLKLRGEDEREVEEVFAWLLDSYCSRSFTQLISNELIESASVEAKKVGKVMNEILDDFEKNIGVRPVLAYHYEEEYEYGDNIRGAYFYLRGIDVLQLNEIGNKLDENKIKLYHNSYF